MTDILNATQILAALKAGASISDRSLGGEVWLTYADGRRALVHPDALALLRRRRLVMRVETTTIVDTKTEFGLNFYNKHTEITYELVTREAYA